MATPSLTLTNLRAPLAKIADAVDVPMPAKLTGAGLWPLLDSLAAGAAPVPAPPAPPPPPAPETDEQRRDRWATQGPPRLKITGGYADATASEIIVGVQGVFEDGSPFNRSFTLVATVQNGNGPGWIGLGAFQPLVADDSPFHPARDCYKEYRIPIREIGHGGHFLFVIGWGEDGFNGGRIGQTTAQITYGWGIPEGRQPLDRPANWNAPLPTPAKPKAAPAFKTNFIDGFKVTPNGGPDSFAGPTGDGTINEALGAFTTHGLTRTRSGRLVDALPVIDGVRNLGIDDCQGDQFNDGKGRPYDFAMGFISTRNLYMPATGFFVLDTIYPRVPGIDAAWWRFPLVERREAYREQDFNEQVGDKSIPRFALNQHRAVGGQRGPTQGHQPILGNFAGKRVRHSVLIEPDRIRAWIDDTLIDDTFNLMDLEPMYFLWLLEGWGGLAAGSPVGDFRTRKVTMPLFGFEGYAL